MGARPDPTGGGLFRSAGGFAEVASLRRRREPISSDERVLGSGTFVRSILAEAERAADETRGVSVPDLPAPARRIARKENIDLASASVREQEKTHYAGASHSVSDSGQETPLYRRFSSPFPGSQRLPGEPHGE